ncbi:MAG: cardiolipin synthase ClsB [Burkholderiales bacterium]|nr:cardiolipin synthase ClsB [Burkholderiales bacterium]
MAAAAGRARLRRVVARVAGRLPLLRTGHSIELLEGGQAYFPALERAIDAAMHEVHLETYILNDDVSARRVVAALVRATGRGVAVRLAVDGFGTPRLSGEVASMLAASSIELRIFRPEVSPLTLDRRRLRRLHRKLVVVDAALAFIGGINLLDDRIDPNHGVLEHPRLDYAVAVRGPLVDDALQAMRRIWSELAPRHLRKAHRPGPARPAAPVLEAGETVQAMSASAAGAAAAPADAPLPFAGLRAKLLLRDNWRFRRTIEREYQDAIERARRDILIANAYFFPGVRLRRALLAAAARGVQVTLLLQGRVEYRLQHYASQALYDELLAAGIRIVEYQTSFLHAKVAVIDNWATVGSSNIDPFSLLLAREANVVIRHAGFADRLRARLEAAMAAGGRPVLAQHHARRALPVRVMNWFAFAMLRAGVALSGRPSRY